MDFDLCTLVAVCLLATCLRDVAFGIVVIVCCEVVVGFCIVIVVFCLPL